MDLNQIDKLNNLIVKQGEHLLNAQINNLKQSYTAMELRLADVDKYEADLFRMKAELLEYLTENGVVHGFIFDGVQQAIQGGNIVITADMLKAVTDRFGYMTEDNVRDIIDEIISELVPDLIKDVQVDGVSKKSGNVANITKEDIKASYESNDDTNAFTDSEKDKLANDITDVTIDGVSVVTGTVGVITNADIKTSYESNDNTNAYTDVEKAKLAGIADGAERNFVRNVTVNGEGVVNADGVAVVTIEPFDPSDIEADISSLNARVDTNTGNITLNETAITEVKDSLYGGTTGQVLTKRSNTGGDYIWQDASGGDTSGVLKFVERRRFEINLAAGVIVDYNTLDPITLDTSIDCVYIFDTMSINASNIGQSLMCYGCTLVVPDGGNYISIRLNPSNALVLGDSSYICTEATILTQSATPTSGTAQYFTFSSGSGNFLDNSTRLENFVASGYYTLYKKEI